MFDVSRRIEGSFRRGFVAAPVSQVSSWSVSTFTTLLLLYTRRFFNVAGNVIAILKWGMWVSWTVLLYRVVVIRHTMHGYQMPLSLPSPPPAPLPMWRPVCNHCCLVTTCASALCGGNLLENYQVDPDDVEIRRSKFHFVDLAGSERAKRTGASGQRFKEVHAYNMKPNMMVRCAA